MSDEFMAWFLRGPVHAQLVRWLTGTGAVLSMPGSHDEVSILDFEGTQEFVTREAFMSWLEGVEPSLTFQMWFTRSDDLTVTLRRRLGHGSPSGEFYGVYCYLDGLTTEQMDSAVAGTDRLLEERPEDVVGIVVDRRGVTADFDWDAFMSGSGETPPLPDLLVVSRQHVETAFEDWGDWSLGEPAPALATLRGIGRS
ncbi:hypothetical protein [Glycomyces buryatensis]|uniref:Uncharacterized protein n=1 Tax=Glycomyces buryatensis TaxID=2570927 RepID=A0A4S8PXN0_9ACTN|nr:hypothetical protein [Glycomyces buryatensis]THV36473.1 hypothetical protein FAB82_22080 [Glycomyces buryatensis]